MTSYKWEELHQQQLGCKTTISPGQCKILTIENILRTFYSFK